ncbi:MAG TPA: class I SAM-dependent methyltransferase [Candidatus Dormibacteraeota bacterium]|nr:class I SAM-dependent methyltransferase [Candidatus Dormibacteraeota bacterium]
MHRDVERFNRWAPTYDQSLLRRRVFEPVHRTVLDLAAAEAARPSAILDVGCGTGRLLRAAEDRFPGASLDGVDAAIEMVKEAERERPEGSRINFQTATAEHLPFPDGQFDLVFSTMTFHHWADQGKGIAEVRRVLKPDGRWLLADFSPAGLMRYVRRLFRFQRFRERKELDLMLAAGGLKVMAERQVPGLRAQVPVLAIGLEKFREPTTITAS